MLLLLLPVWPAATTFSLLAIIIVTLPASSLPALAALGSSSSSSSSMPDVRAISGKTAHFVCNANTPGLKNKVIWMKLSDNTVLAVDERVFVGPRYRVHNRDEGRQSILSISDVQKDDAGYYQCRLTAQPLLEQRARLDVLEPPQIMAAVDRQKVRERDNATFACDASGHPHPNISWHRVLPHEPRDYVEQPIAIGRHLRLTHVQKSDMGTYLCIANNGVPPAVSRSVVLEVVFAPIMFLETTQQARLRDNVQLKCIVEAQPKPVLYWTTNGVIASESDKYSVAVFASKRQPWRYELVLTVHDLSPADPSAYSCVASNVLGERKGDINLLSIKKKFELPAAQPIYQPAAVAKPSSSNAVDAANSKLNSKQADALHDRSSKDARYNYKDRPAQQDDATVMMMQRQQADQQRQSREPKSAYSSSQADSVPSSAVVSALHWTQQRQRRFANNNNSFRVDSNNVVAFAFYAVAAQLSSILTATSSSILLFSVLCVLHVCYA